MITPTIHLNGTSKEVLSSQVCNAGIALEHALDLMREACPNARDYYPQGEQAFAQAVLEHKARLLAIKVVVDEYRDLENVIEEWS